MNASQLRYSEIVDPDSKHKFSIFNVSTVSEMLRNSPKDYFGSNGV
jgi:hypothetical protein